MTTLTHYFGYGSLVNILTRGADLEGGKALLQGWRRHWGHCDQGGRFGEVCAVTIVPDPSSEIEGVVVERKDDWGALDARETGYARRQAQVSLPPDQRRDVHVYESQLLDIDDGSKFSILQSYADCVMHGYLNEFGREGLTRFMATTSGWSRPITADRSDPFYPRAVSITAAEARLFDALIDERRAEDPR